MGGAPKVSALFAFRGEGHRADLWRFIRARFEVEMPEVEIVVGTDDGIDPFHKTLAQNRAAREATGDVFVIADTDTWVEPSALREAARIAQEMWCRPYRLKVKLAEPETRAALAAGAAWRPRYDPRGRYERRTAFWAGPPMVVSREMFEAVRGLDERFRGWGSEDEGFAASLRRMFGPMRRVEGYAWHLWHPRRGVSGRDLWVGQDSAEANTRLVLDYRRARTVEAMRTLIETR